MTFIVDTKVRWKSVNGYSTGKVVSLDNEGHALVRTEKGFVFLSPDGFVEEVHDE